MGAPTVSSIGINKDKAIFKVRRLDHLIGDVAKWHCKRLEDREGKQGKERERIQYPEFSINAPSTHF